MPRWIDTGGPAAQDIGALLIDERNPGVILAGHTTGAISRSTDNGRTWQPFAVVPSTPSVASLIGSPDHAEVVFAATSAGAFVSTDGGRTWTPRPVNPAGPQTPCQAIAFDPLDAATVYAGLRGQGIFRSSDSGLRWEPCNLGAPSARLARADILAIAVSPADPNLVVASLSAVGIVRSTDRGATWTLLTPQLAASGTLGTSILLHPRSTQLICFGTGAGDVYRTTDSGRSWSVTRQGTDETPIRSLVADPADADRILATSGSGVLHSTNFGITWKRISEGLPLLPSTLTRSPARGTPTLFVFGQGTGLRRSQDGGVTWQSVDHGLGSCTVTGLTVRQRTGILYAVTGSAVYAFNPGSSSWVSASSGFRGSTISALAFDASPDSLSYAATAEVLFRSENGGEYWKAAGGDFGTDPLCFFDTHPAIRTRMFAGTTQNLFVSTDRGASWRPLRARVPLSDVRSFSYSTMNAGIVHALMPGRQIMGSDDGGLTWEPNTYGITQGQGAIAGITRGRDDPALMYCWTSDGEGFRSTNRGLEWDRYAPAWNGGDRVLLWTAREGPHIALALVNGAKVFSTSSGGATWKSAVVEKLPGEPISLAWSFHESVLYAGTAGHGVLRITLPAGIAPETP